MNKRLVLLALTVSALAGCQLFKKEEPTARNEMGGKIVFSQMNFEDAKKWKTFEEFQAAHKVIEELVVVAPETSLKYYAVFQEPLNADEYIVQVYDRTEGVTAKTERRDAKPTTGQATGGWGFAVPQWPMPELDPEKVVVNDVWIKPGHSYEVIIMKPMAKGSFRIANSTPVPTPETASKGGKGGKKGG